MQPPHRAGLLIDEGLDAQADPVYAAASKDVEQRAAQGSGGTFDRDLRIRPQVESAPNRRKQPLELKGIEHRRSSAAQVDGIDRGIKIEPRFAS